MYNNYHMGLIFWKCWRVALNKIKIRMEMWILKKNVSIVTISDNSLEPKFEIFILFVYLDF